MVIKWVIEPKVIFLLLIIVNNLNYNKQINLKLNNCSNNILIKAWPKILILFIIYII